MERLESWKSPLFSNSKKQTEQRFTGKIGKLGEYIWGPERENQW